MLTASIRASIRADIAVQPRNLQLWSSSCPHRRASSKFSLQLRVWQASPRRGVPAQASSSDNFRDARLSQAANRFAEGLEAGFDADDLVAQELGKRKASDLSPALAQYKDKVKAKLEQKAADTARGHAQAAEIFEYGKKAYGKGRYERSVELFAAALQEADGPYSKLAGDIQLWLGLSYQACGKQKECIALYKTVERSHPQRRIRKEAANLRFILEAPKLTMSPEERVQLPVMGSADRRGVVRQSGGSGGGTRERGPKTLEEQFWSTYKPPNLLPNNGYILTACALAALALAVYSAAVK